MQESANESVIRDPLANPVQQRRFTRYNIDVAVKVRVKASGGVTSYCYGRGNDVSEGGLRLFLNHELVVGKVVNLSLTLPHTDRSIFCEALVRNREAFEYGLEFVTISDVDRELLIKACKMLGVPQVA